MTTFLTGPQRVLFVLFCCLGMTNPIFSQISTVSGYNYHDINEDAFTVDASCYNLSPAEQKEWEYFFTMMHLAKKVNTVYSQAAANVNTVVGGNKYIIHKRPYWGRTIGGKQGDWILIRPKDNVVRPIVMVTHGGKTSGATSLRVLSLAAYDYVQRGYAVVYYQSGFDNVNSAPQILSDAGFPQDCQYQWSLDDSLKCLEAGVYVKYQMGVAAIQYAVQNAAQFNLDTSNIMVTGFSGGGVSSLYLGLADSGDFSDPLFADMGQPDSLSMYPGTPYSIDVVTTLAGGIFDESSVPFDVASVMDAGDADTRFLLFHGQDDFAVQPQTAPLFWMNPTAQIPVAIIKSLYDLKTNMDALGIENQTILNCSACHDLYTFPCDYKDDCAGNNPQFISPVNQGNDECMLWRQDKYYNNWNYQNICNPPGGFRREEIFYVLAQVHDYGKVASRFFAKSFGTVTPAREPDAFVDGLLNSSTTSAVNPIDFPYSAAQGKVNGHWETSTKCLNQVCTALYFNQEGTVNYDATTSEAPGDYLTLDQFPGANIYNDDFTVEVKFKAIDHSGFGALFSHLSQSAGLTGFEIFITDQGIVRFQKRDGSLGAISGNTSVLDGQCHVVSVVRNGNLFGLYMDGVQQERLKTYNVTFPAVDKTWIGNSRLATQGSPRGFNGVINYVRVWTKALPVSDLGQAMLLPSTPDLKAEWQLQEGYSQVVLSSNNQFEGTLGVTEDNVFRDPKWTMNDSLCDCSGSNKAAPVSQQLGRNPLLVYPNPGAGTFHLERQVAIDEVISLRVVDLSGRVVLEQEMIGMKDELSLEDSGVYLLEIIWGGERRYSRLVVQ